MPKGATKLESTEEPLDIEQFSFDLPAELIAQKPAAKRDLSRLLVVVKESGALRHLQFSDIVDLVNADDVLVVNDTRVIPARLFARRKSGGLVKFLLLKPEANNAAVWEAMVTPIKRLKPDDVLEVDREDGTHEIKIVDIRPAADGFKRVLVDLGQSETVYQLLSEIGFAPLPPYIARAERAEFPRHDDLERYQTLFARQPGAVAAPTAGLHFSEEVLERLHDKGVTPAAVTLHVGPGTFKPITSSIDEHTIEPERFSISNETIEKIQRAKERGGRVLAVGTTTLRALETAGKDGIESLSPIENGETSLYIKPGHGFKVVDCLLTNFHLSRSSLLVLVSAFAGRNLIMRAYSEAVERRYRFYSYGDAMLIV